ncbi:MAG: ABC transporter ATP-binding protein [Treponema sp.]|nr:ABC transporter ATP-binding protein [Treponema sp.]
MNDDIMIKAEGLVKNYISGDETLRILKGINFSVLRGYSAAISGRSGSGKSTLLNILGGLDRSDEGRALVGGLEITSLGEKQLAAYRSDKVGFIFQFHYLLKDFTALENVMLPAYMNGMKKKDALSWARELLSDVNLADRQKHYPSQLSGGERQRVAVARSLVNNPDLILADEPTGNLDPDNSALVAEMLYANAEKWKKTLLLVTHDEKLAARAHNRYTLQNGILSEYGKEPAA